MLVKYNRIYRICPKTYKKISKKIPVNLMKKVTDPPKKKRCLFENEVTALLEGYTIFEEKIDGGVCGLAWNGQTHLAIGKHSMISPIENSKKFFGLNQWIYENYEKKIQKIPFGWIIFGEWVRASHHIFYKELPDYFIAFDIWDGYRYLDYQNKSIFLEKLGFAQVPLILCGNNLRIRDILYITEGIGFSNKSTFNEAEIIEGIVIKNYDKQLMGKYVKREFVESEDWLNLPIIENKLRIELKN